MADSPEEVSALRDKKVVIDAQEARPSIGTFLLNFLPYIVLIGIWIFLFRQIQAGGAKAFSFGKSKAKLLTGDTPEGHVPGRVGLRRSQAGAAGDHRVPEGSAEVHQARWAAAEGRAADRSSGNRQDAARAGRRRRGRTSVLLDVGLRLRRDVRRRRRVARARPLRAGQGTRAVHHLHRRDRRRRPASRRRTRRRARRARADAESAAGRDGRLRVQRGRHPDRRHQPSRRARPGAAAPGSLRPPDRGRRAGPARSRGDPARAPAQQADCRRRRREPASHAARPAWPAPTWPTS